MNNGAPLRIGFLGDGGISRSVRATLATLPNVPVEISAVLSRHRNDANAHIVGDIEGLLASGPNVVVECASHEAVSAYGETVLRRGVSLMVVSIGSLADAGLYDRLRDAALAGDAKLILAPGAIGGIDALAAARFGGLDRVCYRGRKPPLAWRNTPAEKLLDLAALSEPTSFYRGNARQAAQTYPKNSNVAAMVALAGLGFDRTEVELLADPTIQRNVHELSFDGADGHFEMSICGMPSPDNPKTSMLTAHSIVRMLVAMRAPVVI
jgi:aspartate dehydrogenase